MVIFSETECSEIADALERRDIYVANKFRALIMALVGSDGLPRRLSYAGHGCVSDYKNTTNDFVRVKPQVQIDLRPADCFCELRYQLPIERQPWTFLVGFATDTNIAAQLMLGALEACENRDEHLRVD